ncbi:glycoside hydrolase family 85 protein [Collybia nuda]|uniref:Glycoside hydrolase family 85 protein n=1 Tax=Collybia nuda TaxID=64659 RepID=A0A9P5Y455_9AGAR|nr:glycoside hydrolase family 85 protein [Collybia nuda]
MPLLEKTISAGTELPYFLSLKALDTWAANSPRKLDGILEYTPRPPSNDAGAKGKLLVCHDYKGGYTESTSALSYTFNFWSSCSTFIYFSHHRVTVPPPGWITAAHRQGVKMLGTLIFEGHDGGEEDCLRLLVGNLPASLNGPAKSTATTSSLPLSPHYARLLADLAHQRGFDGYLLNFECPLRGGVEQTRTLAAWITLLQSEILSKVGSHGEIIWYDSVIFTGRLAWQDRLNSLNLPFFLSSTSFFTNYTWPPNHPNHTAEYFMSLDAELTGNTPNPRSGIAKKSLNDIYMGIDVWGRGCHGGGGLGCYRALDHISPDSLGLSVALFGQAWTWESEQDKSGWDWQKWWTYESTLWVGSASGTVDVPEAHRRKGEPECLHGAFRPISSFFPQYTPPDPTFLPLHTAFSPGVGRAWFVNGVKVFKGGDGWTDIDKQCSVGDLVWPRPVLAWEGEATQRDNPLPDAVSAITMDDAWNGGSALKLTLTSPGSQAENVMYRCFWLPIQSTSITPGQSYDATVIYKVGHGSESAEFDIGFSVKSTSGSGDKEFVDVSVIGSNDDAELHGGWTKLSIRFVGTKHQNTANTLTGAAGLIVAVIMEDPSLPLNFSILLGQMNIYPSTPDSAAPHSPQVLWADFSGSKNATSLSGTLTWEVAASFPPLAAINITTPDDPLPVWIAQPSNRWFPEFLYFNIYRLWYSPDGKVGQPEEATWIGTTGLDGKRNSFAVHETLSTHAVHGKARFYVQGVTDRGVVLDWERCVYVDYDGSRKH